VSATEPTREELLTALQAVREAIDIPNAATAGDHETRDRILIDRAGHAAVMLNGIPGRDTTVDVPWWVEYLRTRLAEHPAEGYKTWSERAAELERSSPDGAR
jgi:hypothetical protein